MRLSPSFRVAIYVLSLLLFVSGAVWLLADAMKNPFGEDIWPQIASNMLMIHGGAAMIALLFLGALFPVHIRRSWIAGRNRVTGGIMAGVLIILILTSFGLYYSGSEAFRHWLSNTHLVLGLALPVLLLVHIATGRSRRAAAARVLAEAG